MILNDMRLECYEKLGDHHAVLRFTDDEDRHVIKEVGVSAVSCLVSSTDLQVEFEYNILRVLRYAEADLAYMKYGKKWKEHVSGDWTDMSAPVFAEIARAIN